MKKYLDKSVYEATNERIKYIFDIFCFVSFYTFDIYATNDTKISPFSEKYAYIHINGISYTMYEYN